MFFKTQIGSINSNGVFDTAGRRLIFIGDLPVKAGDWVFSDGKYVFGNAPPKGSPVIFNDEPSGIPVLGDNDLRGYFSRQGRFKNYAIAMDDWIVNSNKKFIHGENYIDDKKILCAGITEDGNEFTITDGIYQDSSTVESTLVRISLNDTRLFYTGSWMVGVGTTYNISTWRPYVFRQFFGAEFFGNEKSPILIYKNGKKDNEFDLKPFAEDASRRALQCAQSIMEKSAPEKNAGTIKEQFAGAVGETLEVEHILENVTLEQLTRTRTHTNDYEDINFIDARALPPPDKPIIVHSTAYLLTSNYSNEGFQGLIFAAAYGYCFPYIDPRFIESFTGYLRRIREWKSVPFGFSAIYHFSDKTNLTPVSCRAFGGVNSFVATYPDNAWLYYLIAGHNLNRYVTSLLQQRHIDLSLDLEPVDLKEDFLLPVGEGFFLMDKFGRLSFFNSKKEMVAENIPVHENFLHIEIEDGKYDIDAFLLQFADKPHLKCKCYTPDGNVEDKIMVISNVHANDNQKRLFVEQGNPQNLDYPLAGYLPIPPIDGYYTQDATGAIKPLYFTPLFYQFADGSYLYGVNGGTLYKKDKNGETIIGSGIKNFNLQNLKKISKAKR